MTPFPKGVHPAIPGDEKRIFDLCCLAHGENGFGKMDEEVVLEFIRNATHRDGNALVIIDGPERVEAMTGLMLSKLWYTVNEPASYYWVNAFTYVHPLHRRSRHAAKLMRFTQWWKAQMDQPVVIEVLPREGFEAKEQFFARYGKRIGSTFLIGNAPSSANGHAHG